MNLSKAHNLRYIAMFTAILSISVFHLQAQKTSSNSLLPGDQILITEIMINPQSASDKFGEWFELFNPSTAAININSWIIYDLGGNFHFINNNGPLIISPNSFLVLAGSNSININGGIVPDYVYTGIIFDNYVDEIILATGLGLEIDRIEYSTISNWPSPNGESIIFTGLPSENNNNPTLWQLSSSRENNYTGSTVDYASPGTNGIGQNLFPTTTWAGSGLWSDGNAPGNFNWSNGSPGILSDVFLLSEIQISGIVTCNSLTIEPYGNLTINTTGSLNIANDLIINSDDPALVSGSVIDFGSLLVNGNSVFNRHIRDSGWHFVASPVIAGSGFVTGDLMPVNGDAYMIPFNDGYDWGEYVASIDMQLEIMKGYSVWLTEAKTVEFSGIFNTGNISYSVVHEGNNFNLIGNPYPSPIDWESISGWSRNRISQNIWLWNEVAGNYGVYLSTVGGGLSTNEATHYIPACQGFFVQTTGSNPIIELNNNSRIHNIQSYFKNGNEDVNLLRLSVSGDNGKDEIIIRFLDGATNSFDENIDIEKLEGGETSPQLYSYYNNTKYSISSFPDIVGNKMIPINFEPRENRDFILNISGTSSFSTDYKIIIEDNITKIITELSENHSLSFSGDTSQMDNRFLLHFILNNESNSNLNPEIFASDSDIYIRSFEALYGTVNIYNLLGQTIRTSDLSNTINKIDMRGHKGYFIISYIANGVSTTQKVFL